MEIFIILILILFNGFLAMCEVALISSRRSRLQQMAASGNRVAAEAMKLSSNPNDFLSTIQIGITTVGILAGAFGGATISYNLAQVFMGIPFIAPYSDQLAFFLVVASITYLSLIFGELVPKNLALMYPERITLIVTPFMLAFSNLFLPLVKFLSRSTDAVTGILHLRRKREQSLVSEEEIRLLIKEGAKVGIFEKMEKDIAVRALKLGDKKVNALMTPRDDIRIIDTGMTIEEVKTIIRNNPHSRFPVVEGSIDKVIGVLHIRTVAVRNLELSEGQANIRELMYKPLFIPETMDALKVLEVFKHSQMHLALVIDEYGNTRGLVTLNDILESIVGDIKSTEMGEQKIVKRDERSWLLDGRVTLEQIKDTFRLQQLPYEKSGIYQTLGGLMITKLDRIPQVGDAFEYDNFKFEVIDMDGNRVDKVLATRVR